MIRSTDKKSTGNVNRIMMRIINDFVANIEPRGIYRTEADTVGQIKKQIQ